MNPTRDVAGGFSAIDEVRRRRSTQDAIFQSIINLTMGFLVIAGLRLPALSRDALKEARLLEQLQAERSRSREMWGVVQEIVEIFGTRDLPWSVVLNQVKTASDRLLKAEDHAVQELADLYTAEDGPLPTRDFLIAASRAYVERAGPGTAEAREAAGRGVRAQLDAQCARLSDRLAAEVARKTGAESASRLFAPTRLNKIPEKARGFLTLSLGQEYQKLLDEAAGPGSLDWTHLGGQSPPEDPARARRELAPAHAAFAARILAQVPPPQVLGLSEDLARAAIDRNFAQLCAALRREDEASAGRITVPEHPLLAEADLWQEDVRGLLRARLQHSFRVPEEPRLIGPRARARLDQAVRETYDRDVPALCALVVSRARAASWEQVRRAGVAPVVYDDHLPTRGRRRTQEIRDAIGPGIGWPAGLPSPPEANDFEDACQARAAELFDAQLSQALRAVERQIAQFGEESVLAIAQGSGPISGLARDDPGQAVDQLIRRFKAEHGISVLYRRVPQGSDHDDLLTKRARAIVDAGLSRAVSVIVGQTPTADLPELRTFRERVTLGDARRKDVWVRWLTDVLVRHSRAGQGQGKNLNQLVRAEFQHKAGALFDQRMNQLRLELLQRAQQRAVDRVNQLAPEVWRTKSDDRILEEILEQALRELDASSSSGRDPQR